MILSRPDILRAFDEGFTLDPKPNDGDIDQVSINLRIGRRFSIFKAIPGHYSSIKVRHSLFLDENTHLWETEDRDSYVLKPGEFVLAQTMERVTMPNHLMGLVEGRSSYARTGVTAHLAAPKIDPGYAGEITLEMTNDGANPIELVAGEDAPAQLLLIRLSTPLESSDVYGSDPSDIFQNPSTPVR